MAISKRSSKTTKWSPKTLKRAPMKQKALQTRAKTRIGSKSASPKSTQISAAQFKAFKSLEFKLNETWNNLHRSIKAGNRAAAAKYRNNLILLLGECDYIVHECARCLHKKI